MDNILNQLTSCANKSNMTNKHAACFINGRSILLNTLSYNTVSTETSYHAEISAINKYKLHQCKEEC